MLRKLLVWVCVIPLFASAPVVFAAKSPAKNRKKRTTARVKTEPAAHFNVDAINNPATLDVVTPKSAGSAVVRAQILLDRAHYSPGEIDGHYGDNLRVAIEGYQAAHNLPVTAQVDQATWQALNSDPNPPLVLYVLTQQDVSGPFEKVPAGMKEQATLKSLGYESVHEELGEKFHLNPKLVQQLNPGKDLTRTGLQIMLPNIVRPYGAVQAQRVVVSKAKRTVTATAQDGTVLAQYPATIGSEHDPLPLGDWKVTTVEQNPWFNYDPELFWNANPKESKERIAPGPNNPVGVVWIGLSKEHYGIHGTPEPASIGHAQSHGCIRLTNWDAEELSQTVRGGTPVILEE